jgi:hypothetical protein
MLNVSPKFRSIFLFSRNDCFTQFKMVKDREQSSDRYTQFSIVNILHNTQDSNLDDFPIDVTRSPKFRSRGLFLQK